MKLRNLFSIVSAGMLGCVSSLGFITPANADLRICNRAGAHAFVAISYTATDGTVWSRGWLQLEPSQCGIAYRGNARNADFGISAGTFNGVIENGPKQACIIPVQFQEFWSIRGADNASRCTGRRGMAGFNVFHTGNSYHFTYDIHD